MLMTHNVPVTIHDDYGCFRLLLESNLRVNMGAAVNSLCSPSDHVTLGWKKIHEIAELKILLQCLDLLSKANYVTKFYFWIN